MPERIERAVEYLGQLVEETQALSKKTRDLQDEVHADREERARAKRYAYLLGALVVTFVAGVFVLAVMNRILLTRQADLGAEIRDCTTVGGRCYEEAQRTNKNNVTEIGRRNVLANVEIVTCARKQDDAKFRQCVMENLPGMYLPGPP